MPSSVATPGSRARDPRGVRRAGPARAGRIRWDRVARLALLGVMAVLLYLYISAGAAILSTWRAAGVDRAQVRALTDQYDSLRAQRAALGRSNTVIDEARRLGMLRPGEQAFVVTGLPDN